VNCQERLRNFRRRRHTVGVHPELLDLDTLVLVKPATVIGWHRKGFRMYWRWRSRGSGRSKTNAEIRDLIRRMSSANPCMGLSMSSTNFEQRHLSSFPSLLLNPFVRPPAEPILSSRPTGSHDRRAQGRSRVAVANSFTLRAAFSRPPLDGREHDGGTLRRVGINQPAAFAPAAANKEAQDDLRRALLGVTAKIARHVLVFGRSQRDLKP
jgi:hypothetical protein